MFCNKTCFNFINNLTKKLYLSIMIEIELDLVKVIIRENNSWVNLVGLMGRRDPYSKKKVFNAFIVYCQVDL